MTHSKQLLHKHHCFEGTANRQKCEDWGLYVYLIPEWHNISDHGVHFNKELESGLKDYCQRQFELLYGHNVWMETFKRSYLLDKPMFRNLNDFYRYAKRYYIDENRRQLLR